ncbi:hypothetical protein BAE44_0000034 [Dichanthelium oligosanthes]|uniref:Uncharacterized protein n=1 Tax=Dichanthelium oligosanthes TaxID=888268 RepID=A0A1E5WNK3_9POAL|nr:hypothetical protein BAE44_0000034 [Dichanthelium oligosanthes]
MQYQKMQATKHCKIYFSMVEKQLAVTSEQCSMHLHSSHATIYSYLLYTHIAS